MNYLMKLGLICKVLLTLFSLQFGVICHGDLWWSNILFKYYGSDDGGGGGESPAPVEVKFIDFQSARLASLVTDILSFAFTSMSSRVRRENIYDLLQVINLTCSAMFF